ncbi:hypothetical protein GCM10011313_00490 [Mycetocola zhadangensis]|nr:hypothetical protein GCM10011313_00490 [Mycetocola zhadangensis]
MLIGTAVLTGSLTSFLEADVSGWLLGAMIVGASAGYLAVLLTLGEASAILTSIVLPTLGAVAAFLVVGGVLFGLGSGDPLRGPTFVLMQFSAPGVYVVAVLSALAAVVFRMGTPPHRDAGSRSVG